MRGTSRLLTLIVLLVGLAHLQPDWRERLEAKAVEMAQALEELARPTVAEPPPQLARTRSSAPTLDGLTRSERAMLATYAERPTLSEVYPHIGEILPAHRARGFHP